MRRSSELIVRLSGLPSDVVEEFSTPLTDLLLRQQALDKCLRNLRQKLVDVLYDAIRGKSPEQRHALLAVKRDCHNNRSLLRYRDMEWWKWISKIAGPIAERAVDLELELNAVRRELAHQYKAEKYRQYGRIIDLLADPLFRCGLALASPVVCAEVRRLRDTPIEQYKRKEVRLIQTLLRYVTRAALKLSPFSTFTPVGMVKVEEGTAALRFVEDAWSYRSVVRLKPTVLSCCTDLLSHYPPLRSLLELELNDPVVLEDGAIVFYRPDHFQPDHSSSSAKYVQDSLVRMRVRGPLLECLRSLFDKSRVSYQSCLSTLTAQFPEKDPSDIRKEIDSLIEGGYLRFAKPWSTGDGHLESSILCHLRNLVADDIECRDFVTTLEQVANLEESFLSCTDPSDQAGKIQRLTDQLFSSALATAGLTSNREVRDGGPARQIYQDVWCSTTNSDAGCLASVGRAQLEEAVRSVFPLVRFTRLYDQRQDFLATLGEMMRQRWPLAVMKAVLEVFALARPLFGDYLKFFVRSRESEHGWRETWNPLNIPVLHELATCREDASRGIDSCLVDDPFERRISRRKVEALLDKYPEQYTSVHTGACLFLQPASADCSRWVLNRVKEGTGRFSSRYTPVMPAPILERYRSALWRNGTLEIDGEAVDLLDVQHTVGDTLNVHSQQTPKVLSIDGLFRGVPPEQEVRLSDLFLGVGRDGVPHVRDKSGRRYLPVYLGVGFYDYLPTFVKFLCAFGPTELSSIFPAPQERKTAELAEGTRTCIGNVVLHRKFWRVSVDQLRSCLDDSAGDVEAFARVHDWARLHNIPQRIFAMERVRHPLMNFHYRPQYMDLTSPLFLDIFRSIVNTARGELLFFEMLPTPEMFPKDVNGRAWGIELLVDSLALNAGVRNSSFDAEQSKTPVIEEGAPCVGVVRT